MKFIKSDDKEFYIITKNLFLQ